jgi:hypothetical protein
MGARAFIRIGWGDIEVSMKSLVKVKRRVERVESSRGGKGGRMPRWLISLGASHVLGVGIEVGERVGERVEEEH